MDSFVILDSRFKLNDFAIRYLTNTFVLMILMLSVNGYAKCVEVIVRMGGEMNILGGYPTKVVGGFEPEQLDIPDCSPGRLGFQTRI